VVSSLKDTLISLGSLRLSKGISAELQPDTISSPNTSDSRLFFI